MEWNIMEKEGSMPEFTAGPGGTILPNPLVIRFSCREDVYKRQGRSCPLFEASWNV